MLFRLREDNVYFVVDFFALKRYNTCEYFLHYGEETINGTSKKASVEKFCQPLGLHTGIGWLGGWHGATYGAFPANWVANGGGAFLLIYLLFIVIFSLCRSAVRNSPSGGARAPAHWARIENAWATRGKNSRQGGRACWRGCRWRVPCASRSAMRSSYHMC